ncbi:MAG: SpoIIE family protein phosphatase [Deltaproteobacteria bacterium]|nr:SpoIIE family protein phosphatase [Myxococcales bacterium]MDP3219109.1 SpoIIE family protein phosphatase [Deltaproteobacteria bacterium]
MEAIDLERRARETLTGALRGVQQASAVPEMLRSALGGVRAATGWAIGHAYTLARDGTGELVSAGVWSADDPEAFARFRAVTESTRLESGVGLPGRVLATRAAVLVADVRADPNFPRAALDPGIEVHAGFAVPVLAGDRVVAVLEFFTAGAITVDPALGEALDVLGGELGRAIVSRWLIGSLEDSESRFRSVAQSANDAIASVDDHGRVVFWNRCAEAMFGYSAEEMLLEPLARIIPPEYRDAHARGITRLREGAEPRVIGRTVTLEGLRKDGTRFPVELSLARWRMSEASFYSGIIRDVSERRAAEERLLQTLRRLEASEQRAREVSLELQRQNDELESRRAVLEADLREAEAFQRAMLPSLTDALAPGVAAHACYAPAEIVGGDLYDVSRGSDGVIRVLLADTVGHGVQASLRTMVLKTLYERHKAAGHTPAALLARLNADTVALHPDRQMRFAACCFDLLPRPDGGARLRYANGGQLPLVVLRAGEVIELYDPGPFVGMTAASAYVDREAELDPGDRLFAYTDGLVDQWSPAGEKADEPALLAALGAPGELDVVMRAAVAGLDAFRGGLGLPDDLTLLGFALRAR